MTPNPSIERTSKRLRLFAATRMLFVPSRPTAVRLCIAWVVAAAFTAWYFLPRFACEQRVLSCEQLVVLVAASVAYGLAFAALYVALVVVLNIVVRRLCPEVPPLESGTKALTVVAALFLVQVAVLGGIAAAGALPAAWPWWLGTLGALWS
jgi:hypothetical protein